MSFKFQIGDVLQHKGVAHLPVDRFGELPTPNPLVVLGRLWEECPGGVQKHYRCRGKELTIFLQLHEEELEPYRKGEK